MDFLNKLTGENQKGENTNTNTNTQASSGGGGFMDKINGAMGGGAAGEKKEDYLDKAVDFVQERMGGGDQSNENALEQAKDEQISDAIRRQYKTMTGSDFPIKDKE
ncbi:hypothetical protein DFH06DRAFT_1091355 [Mycena polygramma]|nr:hypothetical protein DFH06DRAFT_1091355 [Mycena polygramma]